MSNNDNPIKKDVDDEINHCRICSIAGKDLCNFCDYN